MKKVLLVLLCTVLSVAVTSVFTLNKHTSTDTKLTRTVVTEVDYQAMLETSFDSYSLHTDETEISLQAEKAFPLTLEQIDNLSLDPSLEGSSINVRYNIDYDLENNFIYLTVTFIEFEEVVEIETLKGAAFYDENGRLDAVFNVDGEPVLMSEMADLGMIDQCGWFSKLVNLVKKVAVTVAVVAAVVAVAAVCVATAGAGAVAVVGVGATVGAIAVETTAISVALSAATLAAIAVGVYLLADAIVVTADVLTDFKRELERKTEAMYMPAFLVNGKLRIIPFPIKRSVAAKAIISKQDFWTFNSNAARDLAMAASGRAIGPEIDKTSTGLPKVGYYYHYHLAENIINSGNLQRIGGHSFFGGPYMEIY